MITKEQAMAAHYRQEFGMVSFRGHAITVRVNGACKTWKTRPNDFSLPIKYGLRECGYIDQDNCERFFMSERDANEARAKS